MSTQFGPKTFRFGDMELTEEQAIKKAEDLGMYFGPALDSNPAIKRLAASRFLLNYERGEFDNAAENGMDALLYATIRHAHTDEQWEQRQREFMLKYPELATVNDNEEDK